MPETLLLLTNHNSIGLAFRSALQLLPQVAATVLHTDAGSNTEGSVDRTSLDDCASKLQGSYWDYLVDLSAATHSDIENIACQCQVSHYTLLSSSAVDLSWPEDDLFGCAQNMLWCEQLVRNLAQHALVVRAGYIVGTPEDSGRFENRGGIWFWKASEDPVQPVVQADFLSNVVLQLVLLKHTGTVRAGYKAPRLSSFNE